MTTRSLFNLAWSIILASPGADTAAQALKPFVHQYSDPVEDLRKFEFTAVHLIVLGLSRINLSEQLRLDTSKIDAGDSVGKTPLMWAFHKGDEVAVQTLLRFGASLDIRTKIGYNVFRLAVRNPGISIL